MKALADFLRPEFIGRVDEVVFFQPLSPEDYVVIARLMLEELVGPLQERGISLTWDDAALEALARASHGGGGDREHRATSLPRGFAEDRGPRAELRG